MKKFACIICGRDKQGAVICRPCRQANNRLLKYLTPKEVFIVMMFSKLFKMKKKGDKKMSPTKQKNVSNKKNIYKILKVY